MDDTPESSGSSQRHSSGADSQRHSSAGNSQRHSSGGNSQRHSSGGNSQRHSTAGNSERHSSAGNSERHSSPGNSQRHSSAGNSQRHSSPVNSERHSSAGDSQRHSSPVKSERHSSAGNSDRHSLRESRVRRNAAPSGPHIEVSSPRRVRSEAVSESHRAVPRCWLVRVRPDWTDDVDRPLPHTAAGYAGHEFSSEHSLLSRGSSVDDAKAPVTARIAPHCGGCPKWNSDYDAESCTKRVVGESEQSARVARRLYDVETTESIHFDREPHGSKRRDAKPRRRRWSTTSSEPVANASIISSSAISSSRSSRSSRRRQRRLWAAAGSKEFESQQVPPLVRVAHQLPGRPTLSPLSPGSSWWSRSLWSQSQVRDRRTATAESARSKIKVQRYCWSIYSGYKDRSHASKALAM